MLANKKGHQSKHVPQTLRPFLIFIFGIVFGLTITLFIFSISGSNYYIYKYSSNINNPAKLSMHYDKSHELEDMPEELHIDPFKIQKHKHNDDEAHAKDNNQLKEHLFKEVKVLCWIMTNPNNHLSKAIHVKNTWGPRCNKLLFMSTQVDDSLGTIALNVSEGRNHLWGKTKAAFKYIYQNHYNDYDWFYKADDDTYTIVENLRYLLYPYSKTYPIYFGFKLKQGTVNVDIKDDEVYMSGGAGYVLSKEALKRFVTIALPYKLNCSVLDNGAEDAELGKCLASVDVIPGDSRDTGDRGRFFVFKPIDHIFPYTEEAFWYWKKMFYPSKDGLQSMSDNAISFHYVNGKQMHLLDYLIYHLTPYGRIPVPQKLPAKIAFNEIARDGSIIKLKENLTLTERINDIANNNLKNKN